MKIASRNELNHLVSSKVKEKVCTAFKKVDRKLFVPVEFLEQAYLDRPVPLDKNSTISQPTLVAEMIDLLDLKGNERILELGTGSGYNAAILSLVAKEIYSIEINKKLANSARKRLKDLGFKNVEIYQGDGRKGLPEKAPFDGIILTAAVADVPSNLSSQLKNGGKILLPIQVKDKDFQNLVLMVKKGHKFLEKEVMPVNFVSLT